MHTLHIEHSVTDFDLWQKAYDSFDTKRHEAGVRHERISRPEDDPAYVIIALDFDDQAAAERFLQFLHNDVWSNQEISPALHGPPHTRILAVAVDT